MMNPSSFRTRAICSFRREAGISTAGRSMRLALRMRVSMSAIGSVIMAMIDILAGWVGSGVLPTGFLDARDEAVAGHVAEADAADAELPVHGPRPAADPAAVPHADHLARLHLL